MSDLAQIDGDCIIIRIPINALANAAEVAWDEQYGFEGHSLFVENVAEFAKDFVRALNSEAEDGTTLVHLMLDKAVINATEDGALGIEERR